MSPAAGEAVFGQIELQVEASAELSRVDFFVDGRRVGSADRRPFRLVVDVGQRNVEHRVESVGFDATGAPLVSALLRTGRIATDYELDVRLRQLYVTPSAAGPFARQDFSITEGGTKQNVVTFERGEIPFSAVVLIDSSASMHGGRLNAALAGVREFLSAMQPLDEAKLLLFSDRTLLETPFTSVPAVLELALAGARATGGTALNDALYLAMKRLAPHGGRRVLILLSDGGDIESVLTMAQVREILEGDPMALYWLRLRRDEEKRGLVERISIWRNAAGHQREIDDLAAAVESSGGKIETIDAIEQVPQALTRLLSELRGQYVLGYYSTSEDPNAWRNVKVELRGGGRLRVQKGTAGAPPK